MSEAPRFKVTKETPYGPHLERIRDSKEDTKDSEDQELELVSRRNLLKKAAVVGVAAAVAEAARLFVESTELDGLPAGGDLFIAIANFAEQSEAGKYLARYEKDVREYVSRIYAQAEILNNEK